MITSVFVSMSYAVCQQRWWIQSYFDGKLIVDWLPMKIVTCIEVTHICKEITMDKK